MWIATGRVNYASIPGNMNCQGSIEVRENTTGTMSSGHPDPFQLYAYMLKRLSSGSQGDKFRCRCFRDTIPPEPNDCTY
eukprot:scaffold232873_cov19-Prasinocladus_malaysianus.AAC.1